MTMHDVMQPTLGQIARRVPGTFLDRTLEFLPALVHEWRTRHNIERGLGHLSYFHLRDVGLIKADVEAACADSLDRSASCALNNAAGNRISNW
jgi:hypothetical protein